MRRIVEYKRLEDDRLQNKGKAPLLGRSRQGIILARPKKDFRMQEPEAQIEGVNVAFKEPVHKILDRIKNESFFRWPNKMGGGVTYLGGIKTYTAHTIGIKGTPPSSVGC